MSRRPRGRRDDAREARRAARRSRLLEAAIKVVRREGPGVSMDAIAREAGVTKPIVYKAFGDREGLTGAVAERFAGELAGALEEAIGRAADDRERVAGAIDAYLGFIERDPAIVRFLVHRGLADVEESGVSLSSFVRHVAALITQSLGEAMRERGLDSGAAEPWAYAIVGAVHLAGDWWLERRTMPRRRLVDYLTALVWNGMESFRAPASSRQLSSEAAVTKGRT